VLAPTMNGFQVRVAVLLGLVLLAALIGLTLRARAGRSRDVPAGARLDATELAAPLGERATFVQFSSPVCSSCRSVHRVLAELVAVRPGLVHVEIDATERLDLARRLGVLRTPTVLLLDRDGIVVRRMCGPLSPAQARAAVPSPIRSQS
jgi:thiol-disulfide isomerase/thioredoxin